MSLSFARPRFLAVLALSTTLAVPAAWAQTSSYDTGSDPVTVDMSVLNSPGLNSAPMSSSVSPYQGGNGQMVMPGPYAPRSRLYVSVPGVRESTPVVHLRRPAPAPKAAPRQKVVSAPSTPAPKAPEATAEAKPSAPARLEPKKPMAEAKPAKTSEAANAAPPPPPATSSVAEANTGAPPPPPAPEAAPAPAPAATPAQAPAAKPAGSATETASTNAAAGSSTPNSLSVDFPAEETRLPKTALTGLTDLAKKLVAEENLRVQLMAYAGGTNLSPSKARRLSLSRALSVRSFLIDKGVRSTRIDVRALGNKTTQEPKNRVDVEVVAR